MTKADDLSLTARQFGALDAVLAGQSPFYIRDEDSSGVVRWRPGRVMGGATHRMLDDLRQRGLLSSRDALGRGPTATVYEPFANRLTVLGLRALEAALAKKRFDPYCDDRLARVRGLIPVRQLFETQRNERKAADEAAEKERGARTRDAQRKAHVEELRLRLARHGLDRFAQDLSDEALLAFARDLDGAEYTTRAYSKLDDADLSKALDELEKTGTVPGSIGDEIKGERIAAIRAEFAQRAEAA